MQTTYRVKTDELTSAFDDFEAWAKADKKLFAKIVSLIKTPPALPFPDWVNRSRSNTSCQVTGPAALPTSTVSSTRLEGETIVIVSCKYHY